MIWFHLLISSHQILIIKFTESRTDQISNIYNNIAVPCWLFTESSEFAKKCNARLFFARYRSRTQKLNFAVINNFVIILGKYVHLLNFSLWELYNRIATKMQNDASDRPTLTIISSILWFFKRRHETLEDKMADRAIKHCFAFEYLRYEFMKTLTNFLFVSRTHFVHSALVCTPT